jgi:peptidoglycan/LPS O-acetylase OafA/YrhL
MTDTSGSSRSRPEDKVDPPARAEARSGGARPKGRPALRSRILFTDIGRAIGALLVVYSQLSVGWLPAHHYAPGFITVLDWAGRFALRLDAADIGEIAVPMFFLISGFVVTAVAVQEGAGRFAVRRLLRVYPVLIVAVLLGVGVVALGLHPLGGAPVQHVTPAMVLADIGLNGSFVGGQQNLLGVAWTLGVELLFYVLVICLLPVLRRVTWYAILVELALVALVLAAAHTLDAGFRPFAVTVSFLPVIIIGQLAWAVRSRRVRVRVGVAFGAACWLLYVAASLMGLGRSDDSYNLALAYAVLLFAIGLMVEPRIRPSRWITFLADRSYEIYLLQCVVLFPALDFLVRSVPFGVALPVALLVMMGVVEVVYRLVDRPVRRLAGRLTRLPVEAETTQLPVLSDVPDVTDATDVLPRFTGDRFAPGPGASPARHARPPSPLRPPLPLVPASEVRRGVLEPPTPARATNGRHRRQDAGVMER